MFLNSEQNKSITSEQSNKKLIKKCSKSSLDGRKENQQITQTQESKIYEKVKLTEINPYLTCHLCKGYLIDATTISECLHSFCRSCIIKFLQANSFCPVCEVIINKAKPNLKLDKTLQDIVYKLVPGLFLEEMRRRKAFYSERPDEAVRVSPEQRGEDTERTIFNPQDKISLSLEYIGDAATSGLILKDLSNILKKQKEECKNNKNEFSSHDDVQTDLLKRYLQCPGMCRIDIIKKFICNKYNVDKDLFQIDILYKRVPLPLPDHYTLIDVAYIYTWKRNEPMQFYYRITEKGKDELVDFTKVFNPSDTPIVLHPQARSTPTKLTDSDRIDRKKRNHKKNNSTKKITSSKLIKKTKDKNCDKNKTGDEMNSDIKNDKDNEKLNETKKVTNPTDSNDTVIQNEIWDEFLDTMAKLKEKTSPSKTKTDDSKYFSNDKTKNLIKTTKNESKFLQGETVYDKIEDEVDPITKFNRDKKIKKVKRVITPKPFDDNDSNDVNVINGNNTRLENEPSTSNVVPVIPKKSENNDKEDKNTNKNHTNELDKKIKNDKLLCKDVKNNSPKINNISGGNNLINTKMNEKNTTDDFKTPSIPLISSIDKKDETNKEYDKLEFLEYMKLIPKSKNDEIIEKNKEKSKIRCSLETLIKQTTNNINNNNNGVKRKPTSLIKNESKRHKLDNKNYSKLIVSKKINKTVMTNNLKNKEVSKTPEKDKNNLRSLLQNCRLNIPSSLSITLKDNNEITRKPLQIPPVQNFIEILKIDEIEGKKMITLKKDDPSNKIPPDLPPKSNENQKKNESITNTPPCQNTTTTTTTISTTTTTTTPPKKVITKPQNESTKMKEIPNKTQTQPAQQQSFQKIFEESIKKTEIETTEFTSTPQNSNNTSGKRNILEIAQQLHKKTKIEHEKISPTSKSSSTTSNLIPIAPKSSDSKINNKIIVKFPKGEQKFDVLSKQTLMNLHSSSLGLNYTVSVAKQSKNPVQQTYKFSGSSPPLNNTSIIDGNKTPSIQKKDLKSQQNDGVKNSQSLKLSSSQNSAKITTQSPLSSPKITSPVVKNESSPNNSFLQRNCSPKTPLLSPAEDRNCNNVSPKLAQSAGSNASTSLTPNQLLEKYNIQNLAQLSASINFNAATVPQNYMNNAQMAALHQAMVLKHFNMQQNRQNWLNVNQTTPPLMQFETYLQNLKASKNQILGNIKDN